MRRKRERERKISISFAFDRTARGSFIAKSRIKTEGKARRKETAAPPARSEGAYPREVEDGKEGRFLLASPARWPRIPVAVVAEGCAGAGERRGRPRGDERVAAAAAGVAGERRRRNVCGADCGNVISRYVAVGRPSSSWHRHLPTCTTSSSPSRPPTCRAKVSSEANRRNFSSPTGLLFSLCAFLSVAVLHALGLSARSRRTEVNPATNEGYRNSRASSRASSIRGPANSPANCREFGGGASRLVS